MKILPETKNRVLANTREASAAFLEDMAHIRDLLKEDSRKPRNIRHLSAILRRLLIDNGGDLRSISPPRIGKLELIAPDNSPFYRQKIKNPLRPVGGIVPSIFFSGGPKIFDLEYRALGMGLFDKRNFSGFDLEKTINLRMDGFVNQNVICLHHEWAKRGDVIKYVANIASGVHSNPAVAPVEKLLRRARNYLSLKPEGQAVRLDFNPQALADQNYDEPFKWREDSLDVVLIEVRAASYFLSESPDIVRLEKIIREEFR